MKTIAIKGATKTGKTTTVEKLIETFCRRGYTVGTVKQVPFDNVIDIPGKDTYRHREAGAALVSALGPHETDILLQRRLKLETLLRFYTQDIVLLESFAEYPAPSILAAATEEDIERKIDATVFAITGIIANRLTEYRGIPVINSLTKIDTLADLAERYLFDTIPNLNCGDCGMNCFQFSCDLVQGKVERAQCAHTLDIITY